MDDRKIELARPRTIESLAGPGAVAHKEVVLRHLGLDELVVRRAVARHEPTAGPSADQSWSCSWGWRPPVAARPILVPIEIGARQADGPGWQSRVHPDIVTLADYWQGGFGVPAVAKGGQRSYGRRPWPC